MRSHDFHESLEVERRWSPVVDRWLSREYDVRVADREEDRRGIDRFITRPDGTVTTIDYKHDQKGWKTGNFFMETCSNEASGREGWALTAEAEWILYHVITGAKQTGHPVYLLRVAAIRTHLPWWTRRHPERRAFNKDKGTGREWTTLGICVPFRAADRAVGYALRLGDDCPTTL